MLEYIKKVAAAGRGGDTKLAYLSSSARQLLKDLGGAGTKNPKTKLPEYQRRRFLEEGEFMEPSAGAPPAAPAFQPPPVMPEPPAAMTPIASEPPQAPPMDPRDFRLAQEPRPMFSGMLPPAAPTPPVEAAPPPAAPEPVASPAVQSPFDDDMTPAQRRAAARRDEDLLRPPQMTPGRDMPSPPVAAPPPPPPPPAVVEPPPPPPPPPAQAPVAQPPVAQPPIAPPAQPVPPPAPPPPPPNMRTDQFIDKNLNGIDDRDEPPPAAQPPVAPPAPPAPPPAPPPGLVESPIQKQPAPPQTGQPPGTGIFFPQPPSSPPPPPPTPPAPPGSQDPNMRTDRFIDKNLNGIDDRDESPASVSPKPPRLRTTDMQDSNNNGIDDRDEPGGADYDPNNPKKPPSRGDSPIMQPPVLGDGIRIPEVPKDKAAPAPPVKRTPQVSIPGRFLDDNTDIGRLLKRVGGGRSVSRGPSTKGGLKRGAPKPPVDEIPGADRPRPVRPEPPVGLFPEPPGGDQPTIPVQPPPNIPVRGPESQIPVRPLPGPLPTPIGAGTPTPYFNPNAGGLTPGTVPVSQMPESLKTSQVPLDAIARNPNLSPTILGGQENLGYYRDRLGNLIMAPGAVRPPGFALGGEVTDEEEDYGEQDAASARAMLDRLSSEAPEFRAIPTKRRARRQEAERGSAKGMAMELEQMSKPQGPRTKRQAEELRQKMELLRDTLGMPTLTRAGLAREGELLAQRFAEGGEAESSWLPLQTRTYLESVIGSDKKTAPLTEKSFSAKELAKLRELIALAEERPVSSKKTGKPLPGVVSYAHHTEQIRRNNPETGLPLSMVDSDFNPAESANLRNTLGTFSFERMPDGSIMVKDAYDYTGDIAEEGNPLIQFANWRGVNRPVSVRLPPEPKKRKR